MTHECADCDYLDCDGSGKVVVWHDNGPRAVDCHQCNGTGRWCEWCDVNSDDTQTPSLHEAQR